MYWTIRQNLDISSAIRQLTLNASAARISLFVFTVTSVNQVSGSLGVFWISIIIFSSLVSPTVPLWTFGENAPQRVIDNIDIVSMVAGTLKVDLEKLTDDLFVDLDTTQLDF